MGTSWFMDLKHDNKRHLEKLSNHNTITQFK